MDNEILVDEEGYSQFVEELTKLKELSINNGLIGSEAYESAIGDGWHDNFSFEQNMRESRTIAKMIDKMLADKNKLKKIKVPKYKSDYINIGDTIELSIKYEINDIETETIKLTGKYIPDTKGKIPEVTLNSPLGKAIYLKKLTDKNIYYYVNDKKIEIEIIKKYN